MKLLLGSADESLVLCPAREEDIAELIALHQLVFKKTISREQWLWKFANGRGQGLTVWVVKWGDRLVFQYAGIAVRVRHNARECQAMVSVDTMAHPEYRRRGLLTQVATATYEFWKHAGFSFVIGLPNEQWGSRASALRWTRVSQLRWWVRFLDPLHLLRAKVHRDRRPQPRVHFDDADNIDTLGVKDAASLDDLWDGVADEGIVRNAEWFRWRYLEGIPKWTVIGVWGGRKLLGCAALRINDGGRARSGIIGEILAPDFRMRRELFKRACDTLRKMGAARVALLIQHESPLEEAALSTGFLPRSSAFAVQAVDLGGGLPRAAIFQGGDFDVV